MPHPLMFFSPTVLERRRRITPPEEWMTWSTLHSSRDHASLLFHRFHAANSLALRNPNPYPKTPSNRRVLHPIFQIPTKETLKGKHVAYYFSSQAVEDQLKKSAQGQDTVRPTPIVKAVRIASMNANVIVEWSRLLNRSSIILWLMFVQVRELFQEECEWKEGMRKLREHSCRSYASKEKICCKTEGRNGEGDGAGRTGSSQTSTSTFFLSSTCRWLFSPSSDEPWSNTGT